MSWPFITSNSGLDLAGMTLNATYIVNYFTQKPVGEAWTMNAICGVLGNMQAESTINPGRWEGGNVGNTAGGFGLVQWTPTTKFSDWATANGYHDHTHMNGQVARIDWEVANNVQWYNNPPMTLYEFTQSNLPPYDLAMLFLKHYEIPLEPNQPQRGENANMWYEAFTGFMPDPPAKEYDFFLINRKQFVRRRRG